MHKKIVLKNGLRVVLVPVKHIDTMTAQIMVRVGSADEADEIAGISHLLEHLLGKGSKKRPTPYDVAEYMESIGAHDNAFTGKIYTGYYAKVAKEFWQRAIDYLADNFLNALILENQIEIEKNVIVEEIKMHAERDPEVASNMFNIAVCGQTPMGRDIAGSIESVRNLTRDQILDYYYSHYHPENCVLAIAGNWQTTDEELLSFIEEQFTFSDLFSKPKPASYQLKPTFAETTLRNAEQTYIFIGMPGPTIENRDWYAVELLFNALGGGASSRMFQEIREKRGLAYDIRSGTSFYLGAGNMATLAGVANDKWEDAAKAIIDQYKLIKNKGISSSELDKAKNMVRGSMMIELEDSEELAWEYMIYELYFGKIITPEETLRIFQNVRIEDIVEVTEKYFDFNQLCIGAVGPTVEADKLRRIIGK